MVGSRDHGEGRTVVGRLAGLLRRHGLLIGILLVAMAVRLWGIGFGLPYEGVTYDQMSNEESKEVFRAFKLGAGEYIWLFGKGGMYLILFVEYGVYYVLSWITGSVSSPQEFAASVLEDRTTAYLIGRVTVAFMGVLTCLVVYAIGRRLYDRRVGLAAACVGALAYFHAQHSTIINVDIGAALAVWTSVLLYVIYEQRGQTRWLAASGALAAIGIAFKLPGGVIVPLIGAAILTAPIEEDRVRMTVRRLAVFSFSLAGVLTIVAPEWLLWAGDWVEKLLPSARAAVDVGSVDADIDDEIRSITTERSGISFRYLEHLTNSYNVALTLAAVMGFLAGVRQRARWDILLGGVVILFIAVMSASGWTQPQRYLLPIVPALWLLSARFLVQASGGRTMILALGLAVVLAVPVYNIARAASERTGLDTRVLAKQWIEREVRAGSRILMDGTQFRNISGPPLLPNEETLERQIAMVTGKIDKFAAMGRGVKRPELKMYAESQRRLPGPRYDLHSTTYGLLVQPLDYYLDNCFDYVVTSSSIRNKFAPNGGAGERYPDSVRFYEQLDEDPRVQIVHREAPVPWRSSGPTITVYRLQHRCADARAGG